MPRSNFASASLRSAQFLECILPYADFQEAKLFNARLDHCDLESVNLVNSDLRGARINRSLLAFANMMKAQLLGVDFSESDLSYANLSGCSCGNAARCAWIENVLSAQNVILCNGLINSKNYSLLPIGHIQCDNSSIDRVQDDVLSHHVITIQLDLNQSKKICGLAPTPNAVDAYVQVKMDITRAQNFIQTGRAAVIIRAQMSEGVRIEIDHYSGKTALHFQRRNTELLQAKLHTLSPDTPCIAVLIKFEPNKTNNSVWLSYLEVTIVPRPPQL